MTRNEFFLGPTLNDYFSLSLLLPADAPLCSIDHDIVLGAQKHETLTLKCEVDSSPPATSFHWTFNSSEEQHTQLPSRLQSNEVTVHHLHQTVFLCAPQSNKRPITEPTPKHNNSHANPCQALPVGSFGSVVTPSRHSSTAC